MEVGSVYMLDHSKLPKSVLSRLQHVKVVTVKERTNNMVCVSYPSKESLEAIFGRGGNGDRRRSSGLMQPNLDLVYTMNVNLAETVLCHLISFDEFAAWRGTRSFWINGGSDEEEEGERVGDGGELKIIWGVRKRVILTFVRKYRKNKEKRPLLLEGADTKEEDGYEEFTEAEMGERKAVIRKKKHPSKYVFTRKKKKRRWPVEIAMNGNGDEFKLCHSKLPKSVLSPLGHVKAVMVEERTNNLVSVSYPSKESLEVGSVYKIDHSKLPESVLSRLGHVKAVMVKERTRNRVSVSYPSKESLEVIFGREEDGDRRRSSGLMQPNLDLVYTLNVNLAEPVLCDPISFQEFDTRRGTRSFWIKGGSDEKEEERVGDGGELKIRWGMRKRVTLTFVRKHMKNNYKPLLLEGADMKEEDGDKEFTEAEMGERKGVIRKKKRPSKYVFTIKKKKRRWPGEVAMNGNGNEFDDPTLEANFRGTKESEIQERSNKKSVEGKATVSVPEPLDDDESRMKFLLKPLKETQEERKAEIEEQHLNAAKAINDMEFHGTTVVTLKYNGGCLVAVDSRGSNEIYNNERRAANEPNIKPLKIKDTYKKINGISDHIVEILVGSVPSGSSLRDHLSKTCKPEDSVSEVFNYAVDFMNKLEKEISNKLEKEISNKLVIKPKPFGIIMCGSNSQGSCSVFSVIINEKGKAHTDKTNDEEPFNAIATGKEYAKKRAAELESEKGKFTNNMEYEDALQIAIDCCFYGTVFDPSSGSPICVYKVTNDKSWSCVGVYDPLHIYSEKYGQLRGPHTVFLLVSTEHKFISLLPPLKDYFGDNDEKVEAAHLVCDILFEEAIGFRFHRIIFQTKSAEQVMEPIKRNRPSLVLGEDKERFKTLLKDFCPMTLGLPGGQSILVYVAPASKSLLELLKTCRKFIDPHEQEFP